MDKIYVAKIGRAVGLKGQQKLIIDSDFPEQFKKNSKFSTDKNQELTIETYNTNNNVVKFVGIDSIESAKKLTNRQLFVSVEDTVSGFKEILEGKHDEMSENSVYMVGSIAEAQEKEAKAAA